MLGVIELKSLLSLSFPSAPCNEVSKDLMAP